MKTTAPGLLLLASLVALVATSRPGEAPEPANALPTAQRPTWVEPVATAPSAEAVIVERAEASAGVLSLESQLSHPYVLDGGDRVVYVHLSLRAAEDAVVEYRRLPMNLALVVDRSGSMADDGKLDYAKRAAEQLVERLHPEDRLALVVYDDDVQTLVPSTGAHRRGRFLSEIRGLRPGGSTNLHGGMIAGYDQVLCGLEERYTNRVLLISDGLANAGVDHPPSIWMRAGRCGERGVQISTMGVGVDYDEVLLSNIADLSGGRYTYIAHPEGIASYVEKELHYLERLVAREVQVRLELGEGVEVLRCFLQRYEQAGRTLTLPIGDLVAGEWRRIVLELRVPRGSSGQVKVASSAAEYRDLATFESHLLTAGALISRDTHRPELVLGNRDLGVLTQAEVLENAEAMDIAMGHQKVGELKLAKELLRERCAVSQARNRAAYHSAEITRQVEKMWQVVADLDRTAHDRTARRDLQLVTELRSMGYLGGE